MSLRYAALRSGAGRPTGKTRKVADVEDLPCGSSSGTHQLVNDSKGNTRCSRCGRSWAELDAEVRRS